MNRIPIERFPWVLGLGLLLLASEWMLGERRRATRASTARGLLATVATLTSLAISPAHAALWSAENAYKEGRFSDALAEYQKAAERDPKRPEVQFNLGAASYKFGDFAAAAGAFLKAATTSKNPELSPKALYNLGNSLYRVGESAVKVNTEQAIPAWENSLKAYEQSLRMKSDDADAKFNRDFVKKKLDELKKRQEKKDPSKDPQKEEPKDPQQQQAPGQKSDPGSDRQDSSSPQQKPQPSPGEQGKEDKGKTESPPPKPEPQKRGQDNPPKPSPAPSDKSDEREKASARAKPGQMTPEDAKALLDALKGDERNMPLAVDRMGRGPSKDEPTKRDW